LLSCFLIALFSTGWIEVYKLIRYHNSSKA
jgi:hypothetical protein